MNTTEALLKGILATVGRAAFPPEVLLEIVAPTKGSAKQVLAYNLCDGETPQADIGKRAGLDKGNLSRTITRWIEAGIVIRIGTEGHPLHLNPLPAGLKKRTA